MNFEPFDDRYAFDKSVLVEDFPPYLMPSVKKWVFDVLGKHSMLRGSVGMGQVLDNFLLPLNRVLRENISSNSTAFFNDISVDTVRFRNVLSYMLQTVADVGEGNGLERILKEGASAYTVEFKKGEALKGIRHASGEPVFHIIGMKLVYRVPPVVRIQAEEVMHNETLLAEAWEEYYGLDPNEEIVITRCTDALSGLIRDKYFPAERKPQLGKLLKQLIENKDKHFLPAESMYDKEEFLTLMDKFSEKRNNHQTGTSTKPTHEEAGFVLHFSIMFFHLLRSKG